jgi:hypothetical protein
MTRGFFLVALTGAALALTAARFRSARRAVRQCGPAAGRCANQRRRGRWSGFTAADFV